MMMSRPQPKEEASSKPVVAPPKTTSDAVKDLERRLALLGGGGGGAAKTTTTEETKEEITAAAPSVSTEQAAPVKGGKNALLARIMAAQERAKMAGHNKQEEAPPPPQPDLLDAASPPAPPAEEEEAAAAANPPPPAFDEAFAQPPKEARQDEESPPPPFEAAVQEPIQQDEPPPAFDTIQDTAQQQPTIVAPPPISAPAYEDLLDHPSPSQTTTTTPLEGLEPMQAPAADQDEILMMQGLSEEERTALMNEQRRIMEQIEQERAANEQAIAAAQADAFDSRSAPAAARAATDTVHPAHTQQLQGQEDGSSSSPPRSVYLGNGQEVQLHGQERTRAAIAAGTAILVQCMNCQNWMQVTDTATLMYCPVCSVVSAVDKTSGVHTREEAMQLSADRKLAEQLQNEEYKEGEEEPEESWWESITSIFGSSSTTRSTATARPAATIAAGRPAPPKVQPPKRGEVGVARPPGASSSSERQSGAGGLVPVQTGEERTETITFSPSNDAADDDEQQGLLSASEQLPKARVAERQPLFSCVVDSVSSAATSLGSALTTHTLHEDQEGNVHGVDASSLLAVTRASRETEYEQLPEEEGRQS